MREWTEENAPINSTRDKLGLLLGFARSAPGQESEHESAMKTMVMTDHHSGSNVYAAKCATEFPGARAGYDRHGM